MEPDLSSTDAHKSDHEALSGADPSVNDPVGEVENLRGRCQTLEEALAQAKAEVARLEQVIRQLQRARFGRSSEQVDPAQLRRALENAEQDLAATAAAIADATTPPAASAAAGANQPKRPAAQRNRGHLPPHLERVERLIDLEGKTCPCCGGELHKIRDDITEQLDVVPMHLRVIATNHPVYGCRSCQDAVVQPPAAERPVVGGPYVLKGADRGPARPPGRRQIQRWPAALPPGRHLGARRRRH